MEYKINFKTEDEKEKLVKDNSNLILIRVCYSLGENYLVFTDEEIKYELTENEILGNKVSALEEENNKLQLEQEQQNEEILVNMLANTEMFEIILGMIPMKLSEDKTKNSGGSSMIEVYCTLIIKGVKTIEDVPLVIREQIIERLKQLEVPVK